MAFEDFEYNGKYCQSGLAHPVDNYTARCSSASKITTDKDINTPLDDPYSCDPTRMNSTCRIYYDRTGLTAN